ncbi:MAG: glycosyltransferase [Bacillota bacterium]|nr:glycosyltransferase [Bacillota bacterium]
MKVLFLQNSPDVIGGVEFVNKTLAEGLLIRGHQTAIYSMRLLGKNESVNLDSRIETRLISEHDLVARPSNKLALQLFLHFKWIRCIRQMHAITWYFLKLRRDYRRMKRAISEYDPDLIVVSYTYMLDVIPRRMLGRTVAQIHTSFQFHCDNSAIYRKLDRYKQKIFRVVWVTGKSAEMAVRAGIDKSIAIYNPIKFSSDVAADVVNNRRVIYIGRISPEKQVDLIVSMFDDVVREYKLDDWRLDLFGSGSFDEKTLAILQKSRQIRHHGNTMDPAKELLQSALMMVASKYEAFSLAVFEANECGVPAIAFEFGEPTAEAIIHGETGIVVERGDIVGYKEQLYRLLTQSDLRSILAANAKTHAQSARIDLVLDQWEEQILSRL